MFHTIRDQLDWMHGFTNKVHNNAAIAEAASRLSKEVLPIWANVGLEVIRCVDIHIGTSIHSGVPEDKEGRNYCSDF